MMKDNNGFSKLIDSVIDEAISSLNLSLDQRTFPSVNVVEKAHGIILTVAIPGFSKDEIKTEVENTNVLKISGAKRKEEAEKYIINEIKYPNEFSRKFKLGKSFDMKKIVATFANGLLSVEIPKTENREQEKSYTININ